MNTLNLADNANNSVISDFKMFIEANREKINRITPVNPSINSDKEWFEDNIWDEVYKDKI